MPRNDPDDAAAAVVVRVVRTGGFAGLRREWTAQPGPDETSVWITLIQDCPWDAASPGAPTPGADRFFWAIEAHWQTTQLSAQVGDGDMQGPWRTLVDAVREFAAPAKGDRRSVERGR